MRLCYTVMATVVLLVLVTWLWLCGSNPSNGPLHDAIRSLDEFSIAEGALYRDILRARAGMLRNYDPLVAEISNLRGAIERLRHAAGHDAEIIARTDRLEMLVDQQEQWTEQFKTGNALLQNSLAYFSVFSTRLSDSGQGGLLVQEVSALATSLLHLTLDTSPAVAADVDDRLEEFSARGVSSDNAAVVSALLAHARMLRNLLPATDDVLKELFAVPCAQEQEVTRALVSMRKAAAEREAQIFRYVLYGTSLLLVGSLAYLGILLQSRARKLRRRAAIEHVIASISTRFINSRLHEMAAHVERALAELADCLGADRAYFVIGGTPPQVYKWARAGTHFPAGWPERALLLAQGFDLSDSGAIQVHKVRKLPPGNEREALHALDLQGWLCVPSVGGKSLSGVLGFDALQPSRMTRSREISLLRMAFDAIANAVDRQSLERDRERLELNLQQARRMETVGALASGIAHNFNNIIGAIHGYAETAQAQLEPGSRPSENLSEIRRAGERARDLVDQILTFGRRSDIRRTGICVKGLITETKSLLDASLPAAVEIVVRMTDEPLIVAGEPAQLQQVILNVCNNAAQAMDAPGSIQLELEARTVTEALRIDHGELVPGSYAVIAIVDQGRGMDEATQERIFEPFFSARPEGNGLGLATVREIVLEHAGALKVESASGVGTRFEIWLPCAPLVAAVSERPMHGNLTRGDGETVLVLEADRVRLLRHEEILAALGYEPVGFTDAAEAAAACMQAPARFDAALVCWHLHGPCTALEHAATLRDSAPSVPIVLAAPAAREFGAPLLAGVGISEIIGQPVTSAELAGALARCLSDSAARVRYFHVNGADVT